MIKLEFELDDLGRQVLSGRTFENIQFHDLEMVPPVGTAVRLENCKFLDCSTSPGTCVIGTDVTLDRVLFSNLDCGDALRISTGASLKEVVISGKKPHALIIQPEDQGVCLMSAANLVEFQLDIAGYTGKVSIMGMRASMVRKDPNRHVTVQSKCKTEINWNDLGIGPFSYWRIYVKKLLSCNAEEGIFSLPDSTHKDYAEIIRERYLLEKTGIRLG